MVLSPFRAVVERSVLRQRLVELVGGILAGAVGVRSAVALWPSTTVLVSGGIAAAGLIVGATAIGTILCPGQPSSGSRWWRLQIGMRVLITGMLGLAIPSGLLAGLTLAAPGASEVAVLFASTGAVVALLGVSYLFPVVVVTAGCSGDQVGKRALRSVSYFQHWVGGFALYGVASSGVYITSQRGDAVGLLAGIGAAYLLVVGTQVWHQGIKTTAA